MSTSPDHHRYRLYKFVTYGAGAVVVALVVGLLFGWLVMFLWNSTIAELFDLTPISFWQAVGLFILAKLFFGFGATGSGSGSRWKRSGRKFQWANFKDRSTDQASFREFWAAEGKQAYEDFRESKDQNVQDPTELEHPEDD